MYKHSDPTHLAFGKSADSSLLAKQRRGYWAGGSVGADVPRSTEEAERWGQERATEQGLAQRREQAIEQAGAGRPSEYELGKNREKSIVKGPDRKEYDIEEGSDENQDLRDETERGA